jgi:hypothetical protein
MAGLFLAPITGSHPITTSYGAPDAIGGGIHNAIDWGVPVGTPIYAAADGKIARADGNDPAGGNRIDLAGSGGYLFDYAHLQDMFVSVGQTVHAGQVIGTTGATGQVTGPHLHFGVTHNGAPVNPLTVIDPLAHNYDKFFALWDNISNSAKGVLVPGGTACPSGTTPGFGPFLGNPIPGWDACIGTPPASFTKDAAQPSYISQLKGVPVIGTAITVGDFLTKLTDPTQWARIFALLGGVLMIGFGTVWVVKAT